MIHKCDQCGESFTENRNLTRHIQSKHADVKYSCDKCNFQSTRKDSLNRHIKSKHAKSSEKFIEQNNDDPIGSNVRSQNTLILLNKNLKIYESILRR